MTYAIVIMTVNACRDFNVKIDGGDVLASRIVELIIVIVALSVVMMSFIAEN